MLISPFSALDDPFAMLVLGCGASGLGWAVFSLAVRELGCELGMLISLFFALVCPFGTLVVPFAASGLGCGSSVCGWAVSSLAVKVLN